MPKRTRHYVHPFPSSKKRSPPRLAPAEVSPQAKSVSPFLSIWTRPRETIRRIVDTDPTKYVITLTLSRGLVTSVVLLVASGLVSSLPLLTVLGIAIVLGPVANIVFLYIGSALLRLTGRLLGGRASSQEARAAWAWSGWPTMFSTALLAPIRMVLDGIPGAPNTFEISSALFKILWGGYPALATSMQLWTTVIMLKCFAEVHRFSAWRAWAAFIIWSFVIAIPVVCLIVALTVAVQL